MFSLDVSSLHLVIISLRCLSFSFIKFITSTISDVLPLYCTILHYYTTPKNRDKKGQDATIFWRNLYKRTFYYTLFDILLILRVYTNECLILRHFTPSEEHRFFPYFSMVSEDLKKFFDFFCIFLFQCTLLVLYLNYIKRNKSIASGGTVYHLDIL